MTMNVHDRRILCGASLTLWWATGCADPCVDDGLSQEPGGNCPVFSGDGTTDGPDPTTTADDETGPELPSCDNGIQDGDETDVDCGGSCADQCGTGQGCGGPDDCQSGECGAGMTCEDPTSCSDGIMNGDETDLDCGGSCPPCDDGQICEVPGDCTSQICDGGTCTPPSCDDGAMNGDETDVDCGGSCPPCENREGCSDGSDCQSGVCDDGTCVAPSCRDGVMNGTETDVDCGGPDCTPCGDGQGCVEGSDCLSQVCDGEPGTCLAPSCTDGIVNGDETDLDCGGACGATCEPGEGCLVGGDCLSYGCDPGSNLCNGFLSLEAAPSCSNYAGAPVPLTATAMGGSGSYTYAWTPDDGSLSAPDQAMTDASPSGFQSYTVTVDDGFSMAEDSVLVVDSAPFDLQNNCTLYAVDFGVGGPPSIDYDMGGTRACELANNGFGLHLCEGVVFQNVRLRGTLEVLNAAGDDDMLGLVWGAQDSSHFYSLTWKAGTQDFGFGCPSIPAGIVVKRVEAPDAASMTGGDIYCPNDTAQSFLLADPTTTTTAGWVAGQSYTVTIDFTDLGSTITVVRDDDMVEIASFAIADNNYTTGFFGSTTLSQANACAGPLFAECL